MLILYLLRQQHLFCYPNLKRISLTCFKKTALKASVYPKSSLLENLYPDHKFVRRVTYPKLSVDNRLRNTCRNRVEYVLKKC